VKTELVDIVDAQNTLGEGVVKNRRDYTVLPSGAFPDGAIIDDEGCLWVAGNTI